MLNLGQNQDNEPLDYNEMASEINEMPSMSDRRTARDRAQERAYIELIKAIDDNGGVECAEVPDIYFPNDWEFGSQRDTRLAKAICKRCPIRMKCLEYALTADEHGIWGGLLPVERTQLKKLAKTAFKA